MRKRLGWSGRENCVCSWNITSYSSFYLKYMFPDVHMLVSDSVMQSVTAKVTEIDT